MKRSQSPGRTTVAALVALTTASFLVGLSPSASASGLGVPQVGSPWSGVTTADGAAVHWNPANLARIKGFKMELSAGLIWGDIRYQREYRGSYQYEDSFKFKLPIQGKDIDPSKSGLAAPSDSNILLPLGAAFLTYSPIENLTLGFGVYGVHGAVIDPEDDGAQRFAVQEAFILGLYITPSIAYQVTDWFSVGVGVSVVMGSVNLKQVVDLAGTSLLADALADEPLNQPNDFGPNAPSAVRELSVLSRPATLETTALGVTFNVGVTFTPGDWVIGASYQHGTDMVFSGDAYLEMDHDFFTTDLAYKGLQYPALVVGDAYIELPFPASIRLGVAWSDADNEVMIQGSYILWSAVEALKVTLEADGLAQPDLGIGPVTKLDLPRNYNNTIEIEALYGRQVTPELKLGIRLGYHSPFSPDSTMDLSSIDGHRLMGVAMMDYKATDFFTFTAYAGVQHVLDRTVEASANDIGNGTYGLTVVHGGGQLTFHWPEL